MVQFGQSLKKVHYTTAVALWYTMHQFFLIIVDRETKLQERLGEHSAAGELVGCFHYNSRRHQINTGVLSPARSFACLTTQWIYT